MRANLRCSFERFRQHSCAERWITKPQRPPLPVHCCGQSCAGSCEAGFCCRLLRPYDLAPRSLAVRSHRRKQLNNIVLQSTTEWIKKTQKFITNVRHLADVHTTCSRRWERLLTTRHTVVQKKYHAQISLFVISLRHQDFWLHCVHSF